MKCLRLFSPTPILATITIWIFASFLLLSRASARHHHAAPPTTTVPRSSSSSSSIFPAQKLLVGGASRSFAQAVLYPVDAMRTLAQTRDGRTLADLGVKTLTKGCFQTSGFALFQGALQFGIFGACRQHMGVLAASALGAAGSCVVSVPQEVIKQRLVTGVYSSFREAVSTIYAQEGLTGFYSSWKPTMMRNVPFVVLTFTTMDIMKRKRLLALKTKNTNTNNNNKGEDEQQELSMAENVIIGMSSALVGGIVTHPVDFIKTRMMTQAASNAAPYSSAFDCASTVFRTEGPMAFYSGFPQRSVYMCGLWGITFALNGKFHKLIHETNGGERKHARVIET